MFRVLRDARLRGFLLHLHYVCCDDPELALLRIRARAEAGGHDVPPEAAARRYARSLANLRQAIAACDRSILYVYDTTAGIARQVAIYLGPRCAWVSDAGSLPHWYVSSAGPAGRAA